ncbi:cyclic pyranopterin monophosphate synthase MoaC [Mesorhizobium sp.]|uniref:cyclic pyranopterin monophosphate synthase MoaC n=1 Tax=Mesorhizobium sp. TaxID=1871066 RepID=UPI000FE58B02|nr:cyclic pyranopterin monophosphate synthase MoaC [Mesorhizobium sp.]RWL53862.1 MAG: hypothetical protein EOR61_15955 [Mesorhizobium sp.]
MSMALTHLGAKGEANMVDVGDKAETIRTAIAEGFVSMRPETLQMILAGDAKKGDVLSTARIAGIMAAKKTCLTIYDMAKAADRGMAISGIRLVEKTGGKSGDYKADT